jgi:hypothetical protein
MATGGPIFLPLSHRDRDRVGGRRVSVSDLTPVVLSVTVGEPCSMATDRDLVQANSNQDAHMHMPQERNITFAKPKVIQALTRGGLGCQVTCVNRPGGRSKGVRF